MSERVKVPQIYKAEILIGTAPFSNVKVYVEDTVDGIIAKTDYLLKHYNPKQ